LDLTALQASGWLALNLFEASLRQLPVGMMAPLGTTINDCIASRVDPSTAAAGAWAARRKNLDGLRGELWEACLRLLRADKVCVR
jgi:hypothetical protein